MKLLDSSLHETLEWIQPRAFERAYELHAGDQTIATLAFRSAMGTLASARVENRAWTLKRVGFIRPRVTVREQGSDRNVAVYEPRIWDDGLLTIAGGVQVTWRPANFWRTRWEFVDPLGASWVRFVAGGLTESLKDVFRNRAVVEIEAARIPADVLPLLVALGWYLIILQHDDDAAVAATTTAVIG